MARKGLSYEEKRKRMLQYLLENQEIYSLKELEKRLPKAKGITQQSVKEVLMSLVYDDLVDSDKIGSGNFFWALPSKALVKRKALLAKNTGSVQGKEAVLAELEGRRKRAREDRQEGEERTKKLAKLAELQAADASQRQELAKFASCDPERIDKLRAGIGKCKESANRWTDNIFTMLDFFKKKRPALNDSDILKYFGLPGELEEVE